jgi:hypothetical protein
VRNGNSSRSGAKSRHASDAELKKPLRAVLKRSPELKDAIRAMHGCESLHVESVAVKEVFEGRTVSTQMNTIILWGMYGTAIAVMANLMAFLTYLLLNDQDDWGKQLMITAKARIRAWKSRSHRMSVATFRFIAKRNALTHGVIARQSKQDGRCTRNPASRFAGERRQSRNRKQSTVKLELTKTVQPD